MDTRKPRAHAGFSLVEVLVSVVVMSFGLLSLAALQSTLFKSGAESRAQSVALAMATEKLEYFDGYRDRDEYQGFIAMRRSMDASRISSPALNTWYAPEQRPTRMKRWLPSVRR